MRPYHPWLRWQQRIPAPIYRSLHRRWLWTTTANCGQEKWQKVPLMSWMLNTIIALRWHFSRTMKTWWQRKGNPSWRLWSQAICGLLSQTHPFTHYANRFTMNRASLDQSYILSLRTKCWSCYVKTLLKIRRALICCSYLIPLQHPKSFPGSC